MFGFCDEIGGDIWGDDGRFGLEFAQAVWEQTEDSGAANGVLKAA